LRALERAFQTKQDPRFVDYVAFSDELESVFTIKGLEKNPTLTPHSFVPNEVDPSLNILSPKEQVVYEKVIDRMVDIVRQRRVDPLTYLEDYDFIKEGTITTNQFRAVLGDVGLPVCDDEIVVLAHKFATTRALDRVNYRSFATALSESAGI
jgi:hypothetical protein